MIHIFRGLPLRQPPFFTEGIGIVCCACRSFPPRHPFPAEGIPQADDLLPEPVFEKLAPGGVRPVKAAGIQFRLQAASPQALPEPGTRRFPPNMNCYLQTRKEKDTG